MRARGLPWDGDASMNDPDAALARQTAAGDARAFADLAGRHRPRLVRLIVALIGDADEAESLAQEALARAYAQRADYRPDLPFGPWLHGIALNLARNHLRQRARRAPAVDPEHLARLPAAEGRRQGVLSDVFRREAAARTAEAIAQLPLPLREAFLLHFVEGMDYAEISRATGLAAGTLRVRAHRARALLRDSLGPVADSWLRQGHPPGP